MGAYSLAGMRKMTEREGRGGWLTGLLCILSSSDGAGRV